MTTTSQIPDEVVGFILSEDGFDLREDVKSWRQWRKLPVDDTPALMGEALWSLWTLHPEFRSLFDYRMRVSKRFAGAPLVLPNYKRATDLYFYPESLGPRCRIQHGHSTWIMGRIGSDFLVRHNCTIGHHPTRGAPTIGNNVSIGTGAVVFGNAVIGNNVSIGPNAVVDGDVPDDHLVFAPRPIIRPRKRPVPPMQQQPSGEGAAKPVPAQPAEAKPAAPTEAKAPETPASAPTQAPASETAG